MHLCIMIIGKHVMNFKKGMEADHRLWKYYAGKQNLDENNEELLQNFNRDFENHRISHEIINNYLDEGSFKNSPWEVINEILKKYKFPYKIQWAREHDKKCSSLLEMIYRFL